MLRRNSSNVSDKRGFQETVGDVQPHSAFLLVSCNLGSPKHRRSLVDRLLFTGKFSDINVVFKATARQYSFASILSVLGKLVKCQILGSG